MKEKWLQNIKDFYMCMQTNFGGKKDKSYIIRSKKVKKDFFCEFEEKKRFDFEKLSKPDPNFVDERKK